MTLEEWRILSWRKKTFDFCRNFRALSCNAAQHVLSDQCILFPRSALVVPFQSKNEDRKVSTTGLAGINSYKNRHSADQRSLLGTLRGKFGSPFKQLSFRFAHFARQKFQLETGAKFSNFQSLYSLFQQVSVLLIKKLLLHDLLVFHE